jgi:very-short-patch-repair endonuclease
MRSEFAKSLRQNATAAERRLWSRLRNRQLDGHKFRRQVPLGLYIADFACLSERLVVEVDGGQHAWRATTDAARTAALEARGYRVLRVWNNDVLGNLEGVLQTIRRHLPPAPTLPRKGGGRPIGSRS